MTNDDLLNIIKGRWVSVPNSNKIQMSAQHFSNHESCCKCGCNKNIINSKLVMLLENMRSYLRIEIGHEVIIRITSWNRCEAHNKKVGGVEDSQHLYGKAVDFQVVIAGCPVNLDSIKVQLAKCLLRYTDYHYKIDQYTMHIDIRKDGE